ncbi:MAG: hypothetical protein KJ893_04590, partial [Candidatus Omnitrophica bacterium]|nr:hypothetical protein [Candidatus Omnitrophota bacterium]
MCNKISRNKSGQNKKNLIKVFLLNKKLLINGAECNSFLLVRALAVERQTMIGRKRQYDGNPAKRGTG